MSSEHAPDSTAETLAHSRRVGELLGAVITALLGRSYTHDLSKTEPPEKPYFDAETGRLRTVEYGSAEYQEGLVALGPGLDHHYEVNRHHPEHFGAAGIAGMTLVDVCEMLADWKAASERHDDGDMARSLELQRERFGIEPQLWQILANTAYEFGWIDQEMEAADAAAQ